MADGFFKPQYESPGLSRGGRVSVRYAGVSRTTELWTWRRYERGVLDGGGLGPAVEIVRNRHGRLRQIDRRIRVPHEEQPIRVRVREGPEENLLQEAEHGRIGADSQRQGQHRHEREDRLLAQRAKGIAESCMQPWTDRPLKGLAQRN
jgi:hypothetical protein